MNLCDIDSTGVNSMGVAKAPADTRIVVAMSGGVDSSVTAAVLRAEGYDVVGVTLQLYDHGAFAMRKGACCAGQDIYDARRVADRIGIPHYVLDYEGKFSEDVIEDFADSYVRGETPIPCVRCNQRVKFRDLLNTARELGADAMATGHYARRVVGPHGPELHGGADPQRDQSYFLFATTAEQLDFLRFPLGGLPKSETRALAATHGLAVADKPDSQDICFVPDGDYAGVVAKLRPGAASPGDIVHIDGRVLGRHDGILHYTIGQRKGLGIGGIKGGDAEPLYVVGLDAPTRRVLVGPRAALARAVVYLKEVNWLAADLAPALHAPAGSGLRAPAGSGLRAMVKLRSAQPAAPCTARLTDDGGLELQLDQPQYGVAPGQAGVLYLGDRLLGGGWISRTA